jgi:hypothetical protein
MTDSSDPIAASVKTAPERRESGKPVIEMVGVVGFGHMGHA